MSRSSCSALLLVACLLSPLWAPAAQAQDTPPPQPTFPTLPADAPAGTGLMQPCMEELEGRVRCGRYRVWENRETRQGRTLDLAFVLADALGPDIDHSTAATFFFGGPGSSVTRPSPFVIAGSPELRRSRDLLFLDFRGVGGSAQLDCGVPYPSGVSSRFGTLMPTDHIAACRDELAQRAQLDLYTSAHNMDDLDELRDWLNYQTLDLNGGSYGTREIQVFLRRHPESARTAILNSVSPLSTGGYISHARGLQNALNELVAECLADAACGQAYPDLEAALDRVLTRVRTDPPRVTADGETVKLGVGELGYALRGLLYGRAGEVPAMIVGADGGAWQPLADYYLQRSGWVGDPEGETGMHLSVVCAEDISRADDESIARETAGTFLGDYLIRSYAEACAIWPYAKLDASYWEPVTSDVPALLLSGSRDPVTPPASAELVAAHLENSRHIVVPGAGHGVGGPCLGQIQLQFVETASVENLDTSCLEERPPTEFVLPAETSDEDPAGADGAD